MTIDTEISLKSLLFITESLEQLLGRHGAQAILRTAGQRAAINLIEMLPLNLPEGEAARRSGAILAELGFIAEMRMPASDSLQMFGNHFLEELRILDLKGINRDGSMLSGSSKDFSSNYLALTKKWFWLNSARIVNIGN